ncbi:hypothetical protein FB451DRAFT_1433432 [Mycena latifolia]|nr:hypothetical protein FB451DRAFT_1433432 [Mycena latifolia]
MVTRLSSFLMRATTALQVPELCDHISDFLTESKRDLKSCALVARAFTSSAHRHLFHDIIFHRGCQGIDDPAPLGRYDEAGTCRRFYAAVKKSLYFLSLVRRLRAALDVDVLTALRPLNCKFPNLEAVVLHRRRPGAAADERLTLAAHLLSAPSIRRVGLIAPIFHTIYDFSRFFARCSPALDSISLHHAKLVDPPSTEQDNAVPCGQRTIKTLRYVPLDMYMPDAWLLGPLSPFDFSALEECEYLAPLTPRIRALLFRARTSLMRLTLDAQHAATLPALLAQFPALTDLTLTSTAHDLADVEAALAAAPSLTRLTLRLRNKHGMREDALRRLAEVCVASQSACMVAVYLQRLPSGAQGIDPRAVMCRVFAAWDAHGLLEVAVL